jgi:hypothetical protein
MTTERRARRSRLRWARPASSPSLQPPALTPLMRREHERLMPRSSISGCPICRGLDVVRALRRERLSCPFTLVSGFLTTRTTVEALRLGAADVLEKPIEVDDIGAIAARMCADVAAAGSTQPSGLVAGSAVGRLASFVFAAVDGTTDPTTLGVWAHVAGVSYSSLRELCRIADVDARDLRDLTRMFRAVTCARRFGCPPTAFLDVRDERTLRRLLDRAGIHRAAAAQTAPKLSESAAFLRGQRFVDVSHPIVRALLTHVSETTT